MPTTPTAFEQALLELINRDRIDPAGVFDRLVVDAARGTAVQADITSAVRFFGTDLEAFRAQMASYDAQAPLAWNTALARSSDAHNRLLVQNDSQSHREPGELGLLDRIEAEGYSGRPIRVGENVYSYTNDPLYGHAGFMIDWGYDAEDRQSGSNALRPNWQSLGDGIQDPAGHREAILSPIYTDIGISAIAETNPDTRVGPWVVTQNFGWLPSDYVPMLLGVVIDDADGDRFYDIGEGLGGVTVTATGAGGTFSTTTWGSGGYQMALPAGPYTVSFSGPGLAGSARYDVTMGAAHTKLDGFAADATAGQSPSAPAPGQGTAQNDRLTGGGTGDLLLGLAGNDRLEGGRGDDVLLGDGMAASYAPEASAQLYRLYQATLDRAPDSAGHLNWTLQVAFDGLSLGDAAVGFVGSPEFQAEYGDLGNWAFVNLLYQNVLGRNADAAGRQTWLDRMDAGASRAEVVLGLSESREFIAQTAGDAQRFTLSNGAAAEMSDDVFRLYQATLARDPDLAGFLDWTGRLASGTSYATAVEGFIASAEFQNTYGALSDVQFVRMLYQNVLERPADPAGLSSWITQIARGADRAEIVQGFAQSPEFGAATAEALSNWIRSHGVNDRLEPGQGTDVMAGGVLADMFIFNPTDTQGQKTVLDLEPWDRIDLRDFDYTSDTEARTHFSRDGRDTVFSDQNVTVTFLNTDLSEISNAMILT